MPSHCSFRPKLWLKQGLGVKLGIWLLTTKPFREGVKWTPIKAWNIPMKRSFWVLQDIVLKCSNQVWFEKVMSIQSFKIIRVPILGFPLGSLEKKCHLDVTMQLPCEHMSVNGELVNGELNFYEQQKIFKEFSCHIRQIFST